MSLILSRHADWRIDNRNITVDEIVGALCGRCIELHDGSTLLIDRHSRVTVAVESGDVVTTVYRMKKKILKRRYSR